MEIYIGRDGQRLGPFPPDEVRRQLASGELLPTDLAWAEGQPNWLPLASFPGLAPAGPPPLQTSVPPTLRSSGQPLRTTPETSGLAIASLVLGILSITFVPILLGIPAVICGHLSLSEIKKSAGRLGGKGMAKAGLIMGYLSCALLPLIFVIALLAGLALPVFGQVRTRGLETKSLSNAKQIAVGCKIYALDHEGAFPKKLAELVPDYLPDPTVFICPLSGPAEPMGYHYYPGKDTDPPDQILLASKATSKDQRRVVIRVDGSGTIEKTPVALPAN